MNRPLVLRPEAVADLLATRDWYEQQSPGLGDRFSVNVSAILDRLAATPELFGVLWRDVRACRVRKFPYVVYYRVLADRIEVLSVLHGNRDPMAWQERG